MGWDGDQTNYGQSRDEATARPPSELCGTCGRLCTLVLVDWPDWARAEGDYWLVPGCLVCSTTSRVEAVWSDGRWHSVEAELPPRPAGGRPARAGAYATELGRAASQRRPGVAIDDPERLGTLWHEVMSLPHADHHYVRIWLLLAANPHLSLYDARRFVAAHPDATGWESVPDPAPPSIAWGHRGEELAQERVLLRRRLQQDFAWVARDARATTSDGRRWVAHRIGQQIRVGLDATGDEQAGSWYLADDPLTPPVVQQLCPAPPEQAHTLLGRYLAEIDPVVHSRVTAAWHAVDQSGDDIYGPEVLQPAADVEKRLDEIANAHVRLNAAAAAPDTRAMRAAAVDPVSLAKQAAWADFEYRRRKDGLVGAITVRVRGLVSRRRP